MSNITSPGSPDLAGVTTELIEEPSAGRGGRWWLILLALLALVFAGVVLMQVTGVLIGLVNPPRPALPAGVVELGHASEVYGVDGWAYTTQVPVAELLAFYTQAGGDCLTAPFDDAQTQMFREQFADAGELLLACQGEKAFSRFVMRWRTLISVYDAAQGVLRLDVVRQIDWFGENDA